MSDLTRVTAFTITYWQREKALALLRDLAQQDHPAQLLEVVVLDDGSPDGTVDAVERTAAQLPYRTIVLRREHEDDYLSARRWNECIAAASVESQIFVQLDDVRARPDLISKHVAWHSDGRLRVVTGAKFEGNRETWELGTCRRHHLAGPDGGAREITAWTAAWGASLSYSRAVIDPLVAGSHERPFDERMTGWGFHEVEFAYRAIRAGAVLVYDPAVGVFHQDHTPDNDKGRAIDHAARRARDGERNERYVVRKHGLQELPKW